MPQRSPEERRARQVVENAQIGGEVEDPPIATVMTLDDMHRDLIYVGSQGAVVHRVTKRVRKREAAADEYATSMHTWIDERGKGKAVPCTQGVDSIA